MPSIPEVSATDSSGALAALNEAGAVVLHNITSEEERGAVLAELAPYISDARVQTDVDEEAFYPGNTKRIVALVRRTPAVHDWIVDPNLLGLCDGILAPNCARYQLHVATALVIGPGARGQVLHREDDPYPFFPVPRPNLVLASMWALSPFTKDNGATLIVPGSHRWEADRTAEPDEVLSAEMPAGSALVWMGGTLHGAGENRSSEWRHGVFLSYSLGWLRQEENQYLDTPPEVALTLSPELFKLIGYGPHLGLGFYDREFVAGAEASLSED